MAVENETPAGNETELGGGGTSTETETPVDLSSATPVTFKDTDVVEVTVDGKPERMTYAEAKAGWQRQADYTRKTQGVSAKARELQTLYEGLSTKEKALLEKEAAIDAILGRSGPKTKQEELNPEDVTTVGQVKKMLDEFRASMTGEVSTKLTAAQQEAEQQRTFQRWEDMTQQAVTSLTKENPLLGKIPHLDAILKKEAKQYNPQSEQEMVQAIIKAGKKLANEFDTEFKERSKQNALRKSQLRENGPAPKGGETVFQSPKKAYGTGRKIDWKDIEKDVISAIEGNEQD